MFETNDIKVKCCWCGWHGMESELDFDEHDIPCYCPVCGKSDCIMDNPDEEEEEE